MTFTYEETENMVVKTDENGNQWFIPKDPSNSDYQAYLNKNNPTSGTIS